MKETLFSIGIQHKRTKEKTNILIWAENVDKATHSLAGVVFGYDCEYNWTGSNPIYENNKFVTRER